MTILFSSLCLFGSFSCPGFAASIKPLVTINLNPGPFTGPDNAIVGDLENPTANLDCKGRSGFQSRSEFLISCVSSTGYSLFGNLSSDEAGIDESGIGTMTLINPKDQRIQLDCARAGNSVFCVVTSPNLRAASQSTFSLHCGIGPRAAILLINHFVNDGSLKNCTVPNGIMQITMPVKSSPGVFIVKAECSGSAKYFSVTPVYQSGEQPGGKICSGKFDMVDPSVVSGHNFDPSN